MKRIIISAFVIAAITGCQKSENQISDDNSSSVVEFVSNGISTRVNEDGSEWSVDDLIGITKSDNLDSGALSFNESESNVLYTATTADGSNTITFVADKESIPLEYSSTGTMNFYSYYPYCETLSDNIYPVSLSTDGSFVDLMWATATDISIYETVMFSFEHKMTKLELSIINDDALEFFNDIDISISGVSTSAKFDIITGDFSDVDSDNTTSITTTNSNYIIDSSSSDGYSITDGVDVDKVVATALILPETITSDMVITLGIGEKTYQVTINEGQEFNSGTIYGYKISVRNSTISTIATISEWGAEVAGDEPYAIEQETYMYQ